MLTKHSVVIVFLLLTLVHSSHIGFKDCNFTDFRFQSKYNLGKQDQLNNTFDSLGPKIKIPDILYPINSYTNYSFTQIKSSLQYLDSKQKAEIMGNDTILIDGGYLLVNLDMKWSRKDFLERGGSLQATCKSQEIMFTKNLTIQRGFLLYQVQEYFNVTFDSNCTITRYEPANASDLDMGYLKQLLNQRDDNKDTAKSSLINEINKRYLAELNNSLYNQKHQLDENFTYKWADSSKNKSLQIQYQVLPTGVDLEKAGLSFTFITEIRNYEKWQCGATIPHTNLDVKKYGGIQEFLSLSIFQNTLKYAIEAGALDTVLEKKTWSSRMFQFYAGDLYQTIPYISHTYTAKQTITGICKGIPDNVLISPEQKINQLLVKTQHNCQLFIKGSIKILEVKIILFSYVQAKFQEEAKVNFYVKKITHNLSYFEQPLFKIEDYSLANALVVSTLNGLIGTKTFGSGWPIFEMDLPELKVMPEGYLVFYDSSHIGDQVQQTQSMI